MIQVGIDFKTFEKVSKKYYSILAWAQSQNMLWICPEVKQMEIGSATYQY